MSMTDAYSSSFSTDLLSEVYTCCLANITKIMHVNWRLMQQNCQLDPLRMSLRAYGAPSDVSLGIIFFFCSAPQLNPIGSIASLEVLQWGMLTTAQIGRWAWSKFYLNGSGVDSSMHNFEADESIHFLCYIKFIDTLSFGAFLIPSLSNKWASILEVTTTVNSCWTSNSWRNRREWLTRMATAKEQDKAACISSIGRVFGPPLRCAVQNGGPSASGRHLGWPHLWNRKWGHPIVGQKGGEGKTFLQNYIKYNYSGRRVIVTDIATSTKDIAYFLSKFPLECKDIFLFNHPCSTTETIAYDMLEGIKDGHKVSAKYDTRGLFFKTPNTVIVFSNEFPMTGALKKDRWRIYEIIDEELCHKTPSTSKPSWLSFMPDKIQQPKYYHYLKYF